MNVEMSPVLLITTTSVGDAAENLPWHLKG